MLFPTVNWPMTSALAANFAYLYTLPFYTFFSSLYHNVVIQSTLLQHCNSLCSLSKSFFRKIGIERLILALVVLKVIGVGSLVYKGLIGLGGFYRVVFRQRLAVII